MNKIDQEYVNKNIDDIVDFMKMIEPENSHNARNWKKALLKNWEEGKSKYVVVSYSKYTEGMNMKNNYTTRIDKFYFKESELETKIEREAPVLRNLEAHQKTWRHITQTMRNELIEKEGKIEYDKFIASNLQLISYYGL